MAPNILGQDVSRETLEMLEHYENLVIKWNPTINLVSKSSISDLWKRHIADSAQVFEIIQNEGLWVDIGSGGGFPGIVTAILAKDLSPAQQTVLIESDVRKSVFLRTVIRELDLKARVITARIEAVDPQNAQVLSARALADLSQLLEFAGRHLKAGGTALFMKGASWEKEVEAARNDWSFSLNAHKSRTNPAAAILEVKEIERA